MQWWVLGSPVLLVLADGLSLALLLGPCATGLASCRLGGRRQSGPSS